ncbi:MAG: PD40 domain-containing protein [Acidobacteria bacterium]|nr:PD40 domain-containing protein [Acidobacteriota bacterium]
MAGEINNLYQFGEFRFDGGKQKLYRQDELILLSPKAAELLHLLLERQGEFVSKEEIFARVWADTFVEDGVLTQNIYTLRKILGSDSDKQPLIENRTRRGYRITVPVRLVEKDTNQIAKAKTNGSQEPLEDIIAEVHPSTLAANQPANLAATQPRNGKRLSLVLLGSAILLMTTGFFGYRFFRPQILSFFRKPIEIVKFQSLTNTGDIWHLTLSPDGNFAAFVRGKAIYLKDITTSQEIKLEIPNASSFGALQFSPDGKFIFFRSTFVLRKEASILQISRFGGETKLLAEKTWGSFGVSRDGKQIAFVRNVAEQAKQILTIKNLASGEERELLAVNFPEMFLFNCAPSWSPDHQKLAFVVESFTSRRTSLFVVDQASGQKEEIKTSLRQFEQVAWLPDNDSLIASASDGGKFFHLWKIFYPDGEAQRITNGLNSYGKISLSADGKKILALQIAESSNLFIAPQENLYEQKQITFGNANNVGQTDLDWADENRLVYVSYTEENPVANLWSMNLPDLSRRQLTANTDFHALAPAISADGKAIYFTTSQSPLVNIWRMDANGGNLTQITDGKESWRMFPQVSQDGKFLYYIFRNPEGGGIKRLNLAENIEETLLERGAANPVSHLSLSLDGKRLMFVNWANKVGGDDDESNFQLGIVATENPCEIKFFDVKLANFAMEIAADGKAFDYLSWEKGKTRILRQSLEGGEAKEIFSLPQERRIFNFAWSKSGKQLAISHGHLYREAVLLSNF